MTTLAPVARVLSVSCMLCGRTAGELVDERFVPDPRCRPPRASANGPQCGECGGSLYAEQIFASSEVGPPRPKSNVGSPKSCGPPPPSPTAVLLRIEHILESPAQQNSRVAPDDEASLAELTASIRQHGVLQPIVVRPLMEAPEAPAHARYAVIAGNRRLRAARAAGLDEIPCTIRLADADQAFLLNVVENLQRRELSGRERVRVIALLSRLSDASGHPLGVREISRRTGLSPATISLWLRLDRRPLLRRALEEERLDVGRAMKLVAVPEEELDQLIEQAGRVSSDELAREVAWRRRAPESVATRRALANRRHAEAAVRAVELIDDPCGAARATLVKLRERLDALLATQPSDVYSVNSDYTG